MRENQISYPEQEASNVYQEREISVGIVFDGACICGDGLRTLCIAVPDHSEWKKTYLAWCEDCQQVRASIVTSEIVRRPLFKVQP